MTKKEAIKLFEDKKVRTLWDIDQEQWYFSIVDVISVLTGQKNYQGARNYWKILKFRLIKEGNETVTNCNQLKLLAEDGKMRLTDVADTVQKMINQRNQINHSSDCIFKFMFINTYLNN